MKRSAVYVGNDRILLRTAAGYKLYADARDVSITPHLVLDGVYEEHTDAALRALVRPGMHVLEIGANIGLFTVLMAHRTGSSGTIRSFECDPTLAQIARDNLEINGLSRIGTIDERAVSDAPGTLRFFTAERHRGGGTLVEGLQQIPELTQQERREIAVTATSLDVFLNEHPQRVDFIKIDAEGAEAAILRGGSSLFEDRAKPLVVMMEFAPRFMREAHGDPAETLDALADAGFTFSRIDERRRRIVDVSRDALLGAEFSDMVMTRR